MVMKFYKENVWAAVAITLLRIYVGWTWLIHGFDKLKDGFDAAGFLNNAVNKPVVDKATNELLFPNFTYFIEHFALPNVKLINFMIPLGEFLIGLGILVGGLTLTAAFFGMLLNFLFMFAGTVSTNPWLLLLGFIIFTAGANAERFGLDAYLLPLLRKMWAKLTHKQDAGPQGGGKDTTLPR